MIPMILTGLAGLALGLTIMRLLQSPRPTDARRDNDPDIDAPDAGMPASDPPVASRPALLRPRNAYVAAGVLAMLAAGISLTRPAEPLAMPAGAAAVVPTSPIIPAAGTTKPLDDVDTMMSRLEQRLQDKPNGEGYRMLGWSYQNTGKPADALKAYAKAVELLPDRADVHAGYGEAMVGVANDVVTPAAKAQFDRAATLDPSEPRARFFAGLYKLQHGQTRAALDDWIALSNAWSPDQRWQADIQQRINALAAKEGVRITGRLQPLAAPAATTPLPTGGGPDAAAVKAADQLTAPERTAMIDGMVDGLATRLKSNPNDIDGWLKLIRSRVVLKDIPRARDELTIARKVFAGEAAKLAQLNSLAAELGL